MDKTKSVAAAALFQQYKGELDLCPVSDVNAFGEISGSVHVTQIAIVHTYDVGTFKIDILRITAKHSDSNVDTTLVTYKMADLPTIYIYAEMASLPLSVINQLINCNFTSKGTVGREHIHDTNFISLKFAQFIPEYNTVKFFDGSYASVGYDTADMQRRQPLHYAQPYMGQQRVPASMFGGRDNEKSSIFGQSVEKSTEDEVTSLRRELRELTGRYIKLEQFVYDNTPIEFLGLECHLLSSVPEIEYERAIHLRGVSHRTRMFISGEKAYIANDGKWMEYRGEHSVLVDAWFKELFKNPFGLAAIREMGFFYYNGVRFDLLNGTLSEDIIMVHNFYGWDVCERSIYNTVITDYGHGKGYVLIKDSTSGRVDTFMFTANKLDLSTLTLSEEHVGRAKLPKVCGYAYTGSVIKSSTVWCVIEARAAVRATIIQASRERLNYRRNNQMVIGRDFELECINDFPKYDFLPEMNSGELYRFKLMKSNITVYVYFNGKDAPEELHLEEVECAKMDLLDGTITACKLREHCTRLVKHYGLA